MRTHPLPYYPLYCLTRFTSIGVCPGTNEVSSSSLLVILNEVNPRSDLKGVHPATRLA